MDRSGVTLDRPDPAAAPGPAILTFLIADIRGYTLFTAEHGDEAAARLTTRFAALAQDGVETGGGTVIELRGDEALAVFHSARQAIRTAIELQQRFVDETVANPEMPLAVGIGLDAGEAVRVEDGYRGGALNLAARLCALAGPAEILATQEVVHLARKVEGVTYVDRGTVRLKGLTDPVTVIRLRAEAQDAAEDMAFRRALGPDAARLSPAVPGVVVPNPYKGLRAFQEGDTQDFFGREDLTQQLVERLIETRFLAVVGPSGSGKSSVVRAGLVPALRGGAIAGSSGWLIAEMAPGAQPLEEIEAALLRVAVNPPKSLIEQLERDDRGLLRATKRVLPAGSSELLLVIDQFEEVFTLVEDEATRRHFLESLEAAVSEPHGRLRVVVTLRADLYDRPLRYRGFAELLRSRVEAVVPLSPEELERAITGPAKRVDVRLEQGLLAQMLADVSDEPGALPLLEYALTELFERREGDLLTVEAYRAIGRASGALSRKAQELYEELDAAGREATRQLFLRLVALGEGTEDTRRPVPRSELTSLDVDQQAMARALDSFGASRLLSFDRDSRTGAPTVEVAHEALLTVWDRLRRWVDQARDDLRTERRLAVAAHEWLDAGRDPSFLVSGSRLDQFETWRHSGAISITPEERDFLGASIDARDRGRAEEQARRARERALERRSVRRLRALVAVLAAAALIASGLTVFAFAERERAAREGRIAIARELAAAAVANLDVDAERSILLAMAAIQVTRSVDGSVLREAEEALHRAVVASRVVLTVRDEGTAVAWTETSTGRSVFVTEGPEQSGVISIRDATTGEVILSWQGHDADVNDVAFSPDGSMLITTGDDGYLRVWQTITGEKVAEVAGDPDTQVWGPSFSPDGSHAAAAWADEEVVRLVDVESNVVRKIDAPGGPLSTSFSPDGRLAIAGNDSIVRVFDVDSFEGVFTLESQFPQSDVEFSSDGRWIATSSFDGTASIWKASSGALRYTLSGHSSAVEDVAWSPDSTQLLTGSLDGTARLWQITEQGYRELLSFSSQDMPGGVGGVAFAPDGDQVMTGDYTLRAVKVWDVGPGGDAEWINLPASPTDANALAVLPDRRLVATRGNGYITIWDFETGDDLLTVAHHHESIWVIEPSPDGELVASAGWDGLRVWDAQTGELKFAVGEDEPVPDVAWSRDGEFLAVLKGGAATITILDRSGQVVRRLHEQPDFEIIAVTFGGDGLLAAAAIPMGPPDPTATRLTVWDLQSGELIRTIPAPFSGSNQPFSLTFDPSGTRLAANHAEGGAVIWDLEGVELLRLSGNAGQVQKVVFSPDGSRLATAGSDATVRLWNSNTGVTELVLRGHRTLVEDVVFSPVGTSLASVDVDGIVRVWALDLDDLIAIGRRNVTRELTDAECRQYLHVELCPPSPETPDASP